MRAPEVSICARLNPSNMQRGSRTSGRGTAREQPRQLGDVFELVDAPREIDDALRARTIEPAPRRAFHELLRELIVAHRIDGAAFAEISRSLDRRAVVLLH